MVGELLAQPRDVEEGTAVWASAAVLDLVQDAPGDVIQRFYSNSFARVENAGHPFGQDLTDQEKSDLTAFLATL